MNRSIDYGNLMHKAMRGLIQEVLASVAKTGLPGKHHFTTINQYLDAESDLSKAVRDQIGVK